MSTQKNDFYHHSSSGIKSDRQEDRHRRQDTEKLPEVNTVFKGKVVKIQPYGAFIEIPGSRNHGLLHISQISKSRVDDVNDVLEAGETVCCKVISVQSGDDDCKEDRARGRGDDDDGDRFGSTAPARSSSEGGAGGASSSRRKVKIGLSMKVVDQGTGKDLDPNNVQTSLDAQGRKGRPQERQKITLEAVLNTTCQKCGGHGHLSRDCFYIAGATKYDLLPEFDADDIMIPSAPAPAAATATSLTTPTTSEQKALVAENRKRKSVSSSSSASSSEEDRRKHKDIKKVKHETKRQRHRSATPSSSSSSSSSSEDERKRRKRKKKEKEKKKKRKLKKRLKNKKPKKSSKHHQR